MPDELGPAVTALQRKLDEQLQTVNETKRMINALLRISGQPELYPESENERGGSVRNDQFYGKGVATASAEYLAMRKHACQPDEILNALESGGFEFGILGWKEDDRLRSLAISLAKNTGTAGKFHKLPNGAFGLRSWYDDDFLAKASAGSAVIAAEKTRKAKAKARTAKAAAKAAQTSEPVEAKPALVKPKAPKKVKDQTVPGSPVQQEEKTA